MKEYDLVVIGTGSAMSVVDVMLNSDPDMKVAVIDKDEPGGICLTRGCIPTKLLVYPAELVRDIEKARMFGIDAEIKKIDFAKVMGRMREHIGKDIDMIRKGLSHSPRIDYYTDVAEFVAPYTLKLGKRTIKGKQIILCTGSRPLIPRIAGLDKVEFHTSDTILRLKKRPDSLVIVGGGYIAAEYGHFFSAMGTKVTIVGRNPQFLREEEPEVSALALKKMSRHMKIITGHEVVQVEGGKLAKAKKVIAVDRKTGKKIAVSGDMLLIAAGRRSNSDILHPEKGGIEVDSRGWIKHDGFLRTSQKGVWVIGDANGKYLFKHVANYETQVLYYNMVLGKNVPVEYGAIPHAVFSHPEIAGAGLREAEAVKLHGKENVLIGVQKYMDTARGSAMEAQDYFVKVILKRGDMEILGAHIIGPQSSVLIQEIINLMYTRDGSARPLMNAMHIHPALPEVVERAFNGLMTVDQYHGGAHDHKHG